MTTRQLTQLAAKVGRRLARAGRRMVTAESCTGGWIAKVITDVPGSSDWFEAGYVTYSNGSKEKILQVSARTLRRHGAVSEQVVQEMARGALRTSGADIAVAVSGIAGPAGGTADKPVGLVWFCWAWRQGSRMRLRTSRRRLKGGRNRIRAQSVVVALNGILDL